MGWIHVAKGGVLRTRQELLHKVRDCQFLKVSYQAPTMITHELVCETLRNQVTQLQGRTHFVLKANTSACTARIHYLNSLQTQRTNLGFKNSERAKHDCGLQCVHYNTP